MNDLIFISQSIDLFWALLAVLLVVLISMWLDRRARVQFVESLAKMRNDARATALYYGLRWLGICLLVGLAVG